MIEILAVRLVAPYLGISLEVFTAIIIVILSGISLGAWLGGLAADRGDPGRLLGPLMVGGGLAAMASPLIVDLVGPVVPSGPLAGLPITFAAFLAPAALLSAVPPVVVKLRLGSLARTGSVVGSYSAIGTAGAIFGTFVTGFILIAALPTRPIVAGLGVVLVLAGLVIWSTRSVWQALVAVVGAVGLVALLTTADGPCEYETTYHCAIVEVDEHRPSGRLLLLDRVRNSYVDLEDPTYLEFRYLRVMVDIIETEVDPGPLDVVSIGGGGFTLPGYVEATRPGSRNLVLEIDGSLEEIGRDRLGLDDAVEVVVGDARISIMDVAPGGADLVVGDAFSGFSVPWHLTTTEFAEEISTALAADGIYTMNVIDYPPLRFARSAAATLSEVFEHVAVFAPDSYLAGERGGNFVLVAANRPLDLASIGDAIDHRGGTERGLAGPELRAWASAGIVLTDDFAPVDQMLTRP